MKGIKKRTRTYQHVSDTFCSMSTLLQSELFRQSKDCCKGSRRKAKLVRVQTNRGDMRKEPTFLRDHQDLQCALRRGVTKKAHDKRAGDSEFLLAILQRMHNSTHHCIKSNTCTTDGRRKRTKQPTKKPTNEKNKITPSSRAIHCFSSVSISWGHYLLLSLLFRQDRSIFWPFPFLQIACSLALSRERCV